MHIHNESMNKYNPNNNVKYGKKINTVKENCRKKRKEKFVEELPDVGKRTEARLLGFLKLPLFCNPFEPVGKLLELSVNLDSFFLNSTWKTGNRA